MVDVVLTLGFCMGSDLTTAKGINLGQVSKDSNTWLFYDLQVLTANIVGSASEEYYMRLIRVVFPGPEDNATASSSTLLHC